MDSFETENLDWPKVTSDHKCSSVCLFVLGLFSYRCTLIYFFLAILFQYFEPSVF